MKNTPTPQIQRLIVTGFGLGKNTILHLGENYQINKTYLYYYTNSMKSFFVFRIDGLMNFA